MLDNPSADEIQVAKNVVQEFLSGKPDYTQMVQLDTLAVVVDRKLGKNIHGGVMPYKAYLPQGWEYWVDHNSFMFARRIPG